MDVFLGTGPVPESGSGCYEEPNDVLKYTVSVCCSGLALNAMKSSNYDVTMLEDR